MILKIQDYTKEGWQVIDDIRRMHYKTVCLSDFMGGEGNFEENYSGYSIVIINEDLMKQDGRKVLDIHIRDTNNKPLNIITDTLCFICNNEGKTIEKIGARQKNN